MSAGYVSLCCLWGQINRHILKHPQAQGKYGTTCRYFCEIFVRIKDSIVQKTRFNFVLWKDSICSLMQVKFSVSHFGNKCGTFSWNNNRIWNIIEPFVAFLNLIRTVVERELTFCCRVNDIGTSCGNICNFGQQNLLKVRSCSSGGRNE